MLLSSKGSTLETIIDFCGDGSPATCQSIMDFGAASRAMPDVLNVGNRNKQ